MNIQVKEEMHVGQKTAQEHLISLVFKYSVHLTLAIFVFLLFDGNKKSRIFTIMTIGTAGHFSDMSA